MLVLGRKPQQSIIINTNIKVTVLSIDHHQIRIGIEAPKDVEVHREEIFKKIQQQKANGKPLEEN